jgi:hypothetical protein
VHRYFGFIVIFLANFNGGIGLSWSYASKGVLVGYSIGVVIVSVAIIGLLVGHFSSQIMVEKVSSASSEVD